MLHSLDSEIFTQTSLPTKIKSMAQHHPEHCCDMAILHREWTHHCSYENLPSADSPLAEPGAELLRSKIFFFATLLPAPPNLPSQQWNGWTQLASSGLCLEFAISGNLSLSWVWNSLASSLSCPAKCHFPTNPWILWPRILSASGPHKVLLVHAGRLTHRVFFHKASLSQAVYSMSFWESFSKKSQTSLFPQPLWKATSPIRNPLKTWQSANASNRNPVMIKDCVWWGQ